MKYLLITLTALLMITTLYLASLFAPSELSQIHDIYIRSYSDSIVVLSNNEGSGGTGFIAKGKSGESYVITNGHVCGLAVKDKILVSYRDDNYILKVVKRYQFNDLCAVEAPTNNIPLSIAKDSFLGQKVHVLGHPLLEATSRTEGELSGIQEIKVRVSANPDAKDCNGPTYSIEGSDAISGFFGVTSYCVRTLEATASTTPILPGNSGSPVLNNYGHVVGVAFASSGEGVRSYFVGLDYVQDFLGSL